MANEIVKADQYLSELDYARKVGEMIVKSGKWSKDWNIDTVAVLVLYARDLGIHPVKALMNGFDIIQGKISMKPILMSDMIRRAGHSIRVEKNDSNECVLRGTRRDNGDTCTVKFTAEDAKKAGISNKTSFQNWAADMLYNRAMGRLGRMLFSDVIGGAYTDGEMEDIKNSDKDKHKSKALDHLPEAEVEITNIESEISHTRDPTIDDIRLALISMGCDYDESLLNEYVKYVSVKKGVPEIEIIKSALLNEKITERFRDSFLESLKPKAES
jgi:hypothetical protein